MTSLLSLIQKERLIVILRGFACDEAVRMAEALQRAGIRLLEVTFCQNIPAASTLSAIREITRRCPGLTVGAGTVRSTAQLHDAYDAGARFILSPNTDPEVITETKRLGLFSIPGAMTPSEACTARSYGADIVKIFPAGVLGPSFFQAMKGPLPDLPLSAVGGINLGNLSDFLTAGAFCAGIGSQIADPAAGRRGEYDKIEARAAAYVRAAAAFSAQPCAQ